jgi:hypothetical protein
MLRIVVAGLQKDVIERCVKNAGGDKVSVTATTDIDAAKKMKGGQADYYIGACNSGGGAALAMAIGILGYNKCAVVAKTGGKPNEKAIESLVDGGKIAFGTAVESIEESVTYIIQKLLQKHNL